MWTDPIHVGISGDSRYIDVLGKLPVIDRWACVDRDNTDVIPGRSGCYALFQGKRLTYIGQSSNLRQRVKAHRGEFENVRWLQVDSPMQFIVEQALICFYLPPGNTHAVACQSTNTGANQDMPIGMSDLVAQISLLSYGKVHRLVCAMTEAELISPGRGDNNKLIFSKQEAQLIVRLGHLIRDRRMSITYAVQAMKIELLRDRLKETDTNPA